MKRPTTDGGLYDYLCQQFGVGDWDEENETPWWKYRALEVSKVARVRKKRQVAVDDLVTTVDYCKAHHIDIRDATWLYRHILAALRWAKERERLAAPTEGFERDYELALERAYELGDEDWIGRLTRALGPARLEVYEAWTAEHS